MKPPAEPLQPPTPLFQTEAQAIAAVSSLRYRRQWEEATSLAEYCLQQFPQCVRLHRLLALSAIAAGQMSLAVEQYIWLIGFDPESDDDDYFKLATTHRRNGDIEAGRRVVEELVRLKPHSAGCHHILGLYLLPLHDTVGVLRAYERAVELLDPDDPNRWGYYNNLANAYRRAGRREEALAALKQKRVELAKRRRRRRLEELEQHRAGQEEEDGGSQPE